MKFCTLSPTKLVSITFSVENEVSSRDNLQFAIDITNVATIVPSMQAYHSTGGIVKYINISVKS